MLILASADHNPNELPSAIYWPTMATQKCLNVVHRHRQQVIDIVGVLETKWHKKTTSETHEEDDESCEPPPVNLGDHAYPS